jgi:uncharacterized protein (DUF1501 family)
VLLIVKDNAMNESDSSQNLVHTTDFRQLQATVAKGWWGINPEAVVRARFDLLPLLWA